MQSEQEMADFCAANLASGIRAYLPHELEHEEKVIRFQRSVCMPRRTSSEHCFSFWMSQLKDFRIYSMAKRYDMGNLWALYADGHRGYCLEFEKRGTNV